MLPNFFWCLPALRASSCRTWLEGRRTSEFCTEGVPGVSSPPAPERSGGGTHLLVPHAHTRARVEFWRRLEAENRDARLDAHLDLGCLHTNSQQVSKMVRIRMFGERGDVRRFWTMFMRAEQPQPLPKRITFCAAEMLCSKRVASGFVLPSIEKKASGTDLTMWSQRYSASVFSRSLFLNGSACPKHQLQRTSPSHTQKREGGELTGRFFWAERCARKFMSTTPYECSFIAQSRTERLVSS